jgi:hypothetical protein
MQPARIRYKSGRVERQKALKAKKDFTRSDRAWTFSLIEQKAELVFNYESEQCI